MATYIKDLKEDNGDITRPVTEAGAVLLSGGGDLETTLASKADQTAVNGKISIGDVQSTDIVANAVTTAKIADGAVTTAKIADNSITAVKLFNNSVSTDKVRDGAVTAAKIAGGDALSTLANGALVEVVGTTTGDYNFAWKYADGRLICFQQYSWSGKSTSAYGQLHSARVMTPKNYAVQFTSLPAVEVNLIASPNQWNGWLCTAFEGGAGTVAKPTEYQFIRPTAATNTNGTLCLVAYGFWK